MLRQLLCVAVFAAPGVARAADEGPEDRPLLPHERFQQRHESHPAPHEVAEESVRTRKVALWWAPIPTFVGLGFSNGNQGLFDLHLGATFGVGRVDLGVDLNTQVHWRRADDSNFGASRGAFLGLGPMFHTHPDPLNGFFFQPRLSVGVFHYDPSSSGIPPNVRAAPGGLQVDVLVGFNTGFQKTFGPFYLQVALGGSLGYGVGSRALPWSGTWVSDVRDPENGFIFGLDLAVVRLGVAF